MGYVYVVIPASAVLMLVWVFAAIGRDFTGGRPQVIPAAVPVPVSKDASL